jgi:hypothetical protein
MSETPRSRISLIIKAVDGHGWQSTRKKTKKIFAEDQSTLTSRARRNFVAHAESKRIVTEPQTSDVAHHPTNVETTPANKIAVNNIMDSEDSSSESTYSPVSKIRFNREPIGFRSNPISLDPDLDSDDGISWNVVLFSYITFKLTN